jgi:hypothetical protein
MHTTIEKKIHFNCPLCHQPIEAPAEASGKLISCPSCGREFNPPQPARKAGLSWLVVFCVGLFGAAVLLGIPLKELAAQRADWLRTHETPAQLRQRFQAEADSTLSLQTTNAIVGLRSIISRDLRLVDGNPANWTAEVTAEYINRVGGVERITLPFNFWTYHSPVDGRDHVLCEVDRLKIAQVQRDTIFQQLGLTVAKTGSTK